MIIAINYYHYYYYYYYYHLIIIIIIIIILLIYFYFQLEIKLFNEIKQTGLLFFSFFIHVPGILVIFSLVVPLSFAPIKELVYRIYLPEKYAIPQDTLSRFFRHCCKITCTVLDKLRVLANSA